MRNYYPLFFLLLLARFLSAQELEPSQLTIILKNQSFAPHFERYGTMHKVYQDQDVSFQVLKNTYMLDCGTCLADTLFKTIIDDTARVHFAERVRKVKTMASASCVLPTDYDASRDKTLTPAYLNVEGAWCYINQIGAPTTRTWVAVRDQFDHGYTVQDCDEMRCEGPDCNLVCGGVGCVPAGHGRMTSAIIGALSNNGVGSPVGVGNDLLKVTLHPLRNVSELAQLGARVINISLANGGPTDALIYKEARNKGALAIASAGNHGYVFPDCKVPGWDQSAMDYVFPAACNNVLSVAGIDHRYRGDWYSCLNDAVDVCAPTWPLSLDPINCAIGLGSGTSAAAPLISGIAGLVFAVKPQLSPDQVEYIIKLSAAQAEGTSRDVYSYTGSVWNDNGAALRHLQGIQNYNPLGYGLPNAETAVRIAHQFDVTRKVPLADMDQFSIARYMGKGESLVVQGISNHTQLQSGWYKWRHDGKGTLITDPTDPMKVTYKSVDNDIEMVVVTLEVGDTGRVSSDAKSFIYLKEKAMRICGSENKTLHVRQKDVSSTHKEGINTWTLVNTEAGTLTHGNTNAAVFTPNPGFAGEAIIDYWYINYLGDVPTFVNNSADISIPPFTTCDAYSQPIPNASDYNTYPTKQRFRILVAPSPSAPELTGPATVCPSATPIPYNISNAADYTSFVWESGGSDMTLVTGQNTGTASFVAGAGLSGNLISVIGENKYGCSAMATLAIQKGSNCSPTTPCNPTTLSISTSLPKICANGQIATLTANNGLAGGHYSWYLPEGLAIQAGQNTAEITVNALANFEGGTISVVETTPTCPTGQPKSIYIEKNPSCCGQLSVSSNYTQPPSTSFQGCIAKTPDNLCQGGKLYVSAYSEMSVPTYQWSMDGTVVSNAQNCEITMATPGLHLAELVVTGPQCITKAKREIIVAPRPSKPNVTGTLEVCTNFPADEKLSFSVTDPNTASKRYTWYARTSLQVGYTKASCTETYDQFVPYPSFNVQRSFNKGEVIVFETLDNGCSSEETRLTIGTIACCSTVTADFTTDNGLKACSNVATTLTFSGTGTPSKVEWYMDNAKIGEGMSLPYTFNNPSYTNIHVNVEVRAYDATGCFDSKTRAIQIQNGNKFSLASYMPSLCNGSVGDYELQNVDGAVKNSVWFVTGMAASDYTVETFGNNLASFNPHVAGTMPTDPKMNVSFTSAYGCTAALNAKIDIRNCVCGFKSANFTVDGGLCAKSEEYYGDNLRFTNTSLGYNYQYGFNFKWKITKPDNSVLEIPNTFSSQIFLGVPGQYKIKLIIAELDGSCVDSVERSYTAMGPLVAGEIVGPRIICNYQGEEITYSVPDLGSGYYDWYVRGSAEIISGSSTKTFTTKFRESWANNIIEFRYTMPQTNNIHSCPVITLFPVRVHRPIGIITGQVAIPSEGASDVAYQITPLAGVADYQWTITPNATFAGATNSNQVVANFPFNTFGGEIKVSYDQDGCTDTRTLPLQVLQPQPPTVPTSFSRCGPGTIFLEASGSTLVYKWYDSGMQYLGSGSPFQTSVSTSGTYYVTAWNPNAQVESTPVAFTIQITTLPAPVLVDANQYACKGSEAEFQVASPLSGIEYRWYTTMGDLLGTGTSQVVTVHQTQEVVVKAYSFAAQCISEGTPAKIQSVEVTAPQAYTATLCGAGNALFTIKNPKVNQHYFWYNTNYQMIGTGNSLSIAIAENTSKTLYAQANGTQGYVTCGSELAAITISSLPLPTVLVTPNTVPVCLGKSATLTAGGANSYVWSTGATTNSITVTPNTVGNNYYTVTGKGTNGCEKTVTPLVNVLDNPTTPSITANKTALCGIENVLFTANGAASGNRYWWYTTTGGTISLVKTSSSNIDNTYAATFGQNTTVSVEVNTSMGCKSPLATVALTVNTPNGLTLDGANDRATVSTSGTTVYNVEQNAFTIEAMVKMAASQTTTNPVIVAKQALLGNGTLETTGFVLSAANGQKLSLWLNGKLFTSNTFESILDNQCHHVAVNTVYTTIMGNPSVIVQFFVDGNSVGAPTQSFPSRTYSSAALLVGTQNVNSGSSTPYLKGEIRELRIWNTRRSQEEIANNRYTVFPIAQASLIGYWRLNKLADQTIASDVTIGKPLWLGSTNAVETSDPTFSCTPACFSGDRGETEEEMAVPVAFNVYPNPFEHSTWIHLTGWEREHVQLTVQDLNSNTVYHKANHPSDTPLQLGAALASGMYILKVEGTQGTQTFKLIKRK